MMYERIATLVPVGGAGTGRAFSMDASVDAMGMAASRSAKSDVETADKFWPRAGSRHSAAW